VKKARGLIVGAIVVALVAVGLAAADLVVRNLAEKAVARQAQTELGLSSAPDVSLGGWPFLVHAATRSFPSAKISIDSMPLASGDTSIVVTSVEATATDISPQGNGYVVGHAEGTGLVTFAELSKAAGRTVTSAGGGKIAIAVDISGVQATVTGIPTLDTTAKTVSLADSTIGFGGVEVPSILSQQILEMFTDPISVKDDQFTVTSLTTGDQGITFTASADNVQISGS
jgi:hypothetical protein